MEVAIITGLLGVIVLFLYLIYCKLDNISQLMSFNYEISVENQVLTEIIEESLGNIDSSTKQILSYMTCGDCYEDPVVVENIEEHDVPRAD